MALKKSDLDGVLTVVQETEVRLLEELIDRTLQEKYAGEGKTVIVSLRQFPVMGVRTEIVRRYKEAGWKLEFNAHEDSGYYIGLS